MDSERLQVLIDLPQLTDFERSVLRQLDAAQPGTLSDDELCQPRTSQNVSLLNRLVVLGLAMRFGSSEEDEGPSYSITVVGEQVLATLRGGK